MINIEQGIMNVEVFSSLQNSEFVIQYSIFAFGILYLPGRDESRPYNCTSACPLHVTPYALRLAPQTLYRIPHITHRIPYTLHRKPFTP